MMILATLAILLSGCVGMLDRIPIMGENADGTKTIVAYASRSRLYTFSKASEEIELWKVSSDNGVEMTGSKASSDSTKMAEVLLKGIELGGALAGQRLGVTTTSAPQPESSYAPAINSSTVPAVQRDYITGADNPEIVILGNKSTCPLTRALWAKIDVASLSASTCDASIVDVDEYANKTEFRARRPAGSFNFPWIRIYVGGQVVDEFPARGMNQSQISARAGIAIGNCAPPE